MKLVHSIDESQDRFSERPRAGSCRTIGCDRNPADQDEFCSRCREEIDAIRAMARRRVVIWGTGRSDS